jgi:peptidoglycan hydrolase CwlO-like protein
MVDFAQAAISDDAQYLPFHVGTYAKLNALRVGHNNIKKKYNAATAHNEELQFSLDCLKADFEKLAAAYKSMSESDMRHLVEIETLKQECDVLKRRNAVLASREERRNLKSRGKRSRSD